MTMLSFRVDEGEANQAQAWADRLGVDRSELLREALLRLPDLLQLAFQLALVLGNLLCLLFGTLALFALPA